MNDRYVLSVKETIGHEIAHYYDSATQDRILSTAGRFSARLAGDTFDFAVPVSPAHAVVGRSRLVRRAARLDKSNAVLNHRRDGIVVAYRGGLYLYDLARRTLAKTGTLIQCRNVLHGGIAVTERGIFLGEYGQNPQRNPVAVWASRDDGRSWSVVHTFPAGRIKHVHGVYSDPYSDSLWVPTGDFAGECFVFEARKGDFADLVCHGDGTQRWRPVSMFFEPDRIIWAMDSQLETSHLCTFDRATGGLEVTREFPGPVWYSKRFVEGCGVLQTTVETGPGVKSDHAHLFFSTNLADWTDIARYRKDAWPVRYFKSGVIAFADGPQSVSDFLMFGEALEGMDGTVLRVAVAAP